MEVKSCKGMIIKSTGGLYTVEQQDGSICECRAKGAFRHSKITPLAGDKVVFEKNSDNDGFITVIEQRENSLIRPAVANVKLLCVVTAAKNPEPDMFILDKLTAVAQKNGIEVAFIVNKTDLDDGKDIIETYEKSGFTVIPMCAEKKQEFGESIQRIRELVKGKVSFFTGASGVGKSSVLNAAFPELCLETGEISKKIQRGKHTTRVTTLFKVDADTYVGDTPGFSMLDVAGFNMLSSDTLLEGFPDIAKYADGCKYTKCSHTSEDGCCVMEALQNGQVVESRHQSYKALYKELISIKPWDNKQNI